MPCPSKPPTVLAATAFARTNHSRRWRGLEMLESTTPLTSTRARQRCGPDLSPTSQTDRQNAGLGRKPEGFGNGNCGGRKILSCFSRDRERETRALVIGDWLILAWAPVDACRGNPDDAKRCCCSSGKTGRRRSSGHLLYCTGRRWSMTTMVPNNVPYAGQGGETTSLFLHINHLTSESPNTDPPTSPGWDQGLANRLSRLAAGIFASSPLPRNGCTWPRPSEKGDGTEVP